MATSVTSAAELFVKKCVDAVSEVAALTQKKIQNPGSIVDFQVSGALADAVSGNLGPLKSFGEGYVKNNSSALTVQALRATGLEQEATEALNIFYNVLSSAVAAYNDLLLSFTKQSARKVISELENKSAIREDLIKKLNAYINTLEFMREGPSVFDEYLDQLRDALIKIDDASRNLNVVSSTLKSTDRFLDKRFSQVRADVEEASRLITPSDNPYLDPDFLTNQIIFAKRKTGSSRLEITSETFDGEIDSGLPNLLTGSFSNAEIGDIITVSYDGEDNIISPVNPGEYKIVRFVSFERVEVSPRVAAAGLNGSIISPSTQFTNSIFRDNSTNLNVVKVGDTLKWSALAGISVTAKVQSIIIEDGVPRALLLDKPVDFNSLGTDSEIVGTYSIVRGRTGRQRDIISSRSGGTLIRGTELPSDPEAPIYPYNPASNESGIIEGVGYKIDRPQGLQSDHKTLIDEGATFSDKRISGHFLKVLSPSSAKGTYKIVSSSGDTKLAIASAIPGLDAGPVPFIEYEIKADLGVPTDADQFSNIMAIPAMTSKVVLSGKNYFRSTLLANAYTQSFTSALDQLLSSLPSVLKNFVVSMFDEASNNLEDLKGNMATLLNGAPGRISSQAPNFRPNPLNVSSYAFKWNLDLNLIRGVLDSIPAESLSDINLSAGPVNAYRSAVEKLLKIDTYRSGNSIVLGEDGTEDVGQLESQLFSLLTEGNTLIFTGSLREEIISLGRTIVRNLELAQKRDEDILKILNDWNNYPLPLEGELEEMMSGVRTVLKDLGLDKMADFFDEGKFSDMFSITNGRAATYVGSALIGLALLKECFDTPEDSDELDKIVNELEREEQLLDVKLSINFDLAIFEKIRECTKFENLSASLNLKEIFCGLVAQSGVGDKLSAVFDSVDSGISGPGEKVSSNLVGT